MKLILFGPPGSGKGTQAQLIKERHGIPHISTGDLFRKNISEGTELGKLAQTYMNKGELVPDDVTIKMLKERLQQPDCKDGFLIDGFPRNIPQAEVLDQLTDIDIAILINQTDEVIIPRLSGRRSCPMCGHTTHVDWLEEGKKDICPKCFARLIQRDDDKEEVVKTRLDNYRKLTAPLTGYYEKQHKLKVVNATNDVESTYKLVDKVIRENK